MHRSAFEGVVEILAMRRGAVDKGRARGIERALMPDRRARAVIVASPECAPDVVLVARGNAEPDDIDQQVFAFARGGGRKRARLQCDDLFGQRFGNRNPG